MGQVLFIAFNQEASILEEGELCLVQFIHSGMSDFCDPMDCNIPGFPIHHQLPELSFFFPLPELSLIHVHLVGDVIQSSHPLSSPFPPVLNSFPGSGSFPMSQFFTSGGHNIGVSASTSVLPMNIQD